MPVIGTNFTKLNVERNKTSGKLTVNNKLHIDSIEPMSFSGSNDGVRFNFTFNSKYDPDGPTIDLKGEVLLFEEKSIVEEVLKSWDGKKPVNEAIMTQVMNSALRKCTLQSLALSQDMGFPPPIQLPTISAKQQEKKE